MRLKYRFFKLGSTSLAINFIGLISIIFVSIVMIQGVMAQERIPSTGFFVTAYNQVNESTNGSNYFAGVVTSDYLPYFLIVSDGDEIGAFFEDDLQTLVGVQNFFPLEGHVAPYEIFVFGSSDDVGKRIEFKYYDIESSSEIFHVSNQSGTDAPATFSDVDIIQNNLVLRYSVERSDINRDGFVTLADFSLFALCFGFPGSSSLNCQRSDVNNDGTVSLADFSIFALDFGKAYIRRVASNPG